MLSAMVQRLLLDRIETMISCSPVSEDPTNMGLHNATIFACTYFTFAIFVNAYSIANKIISLWKWLLVGVVVCAVDVESEIAVPAAVMDVSVPLWEQRWSTLLYIAAPSSWEVTD